MNAEEKKKEIERLQKEIDEEKDKFEHMEPPLSNTIIVFIIGAIIGLIIGWIV